VPGPSDCIEAAQDSYVHRYASGTNYGSEERVRVSHWGSTSDDRALLQFDLSHVPACADLISAELHLSLIGGAFGSGEIVQVRAVVGTWSEATVTWTTMPEYSATIFGATVPAWGDNLWDITDLARDWIEHRSSNHGMALVTHTGDVSYEFGSSEHAEAHERPCLRLDLAAGL
jgi:hypothetical protein